jgi:hypothetical protein
LWHLYGVERAGFAPVGTGSSPAYNGLA